MSIVIEWSMELDTFRRVRGQLDATSQISRHGVQVRSTDTEYSYRAVASPYFILSTL